MSKKQAKKYKNLPKYREEHDTDDKFKDGLITIPKNLFKKSSGHVFQNEMEENHAWEQLFWTKKTVEGITKACNYVFVEKNLLLHDTEHCSFLAHCWKKGGVIGH